MNTYHPGTRGRPNERACTSLNPAHCVEPREAEIYMQGTITYQILRCVACDRPQSTRLVRKNKNT